MKQAPKNLLLTGLPGCGKTTVVRRVIERLDDLQVAGFYTQEVRRQGRRVGFEAVGLNGGSVMLAHADFRGPYHVGRYGVDLPGFEAVLREELAKPAADVDLYVLDEIGKMECMSHAFAEAVARVLDCPVPVLATIAAKGSGLIAAVKARPDVRILTASPGNRDRLPDELIRYIRAR